MSLPSLSVIMPNYNHGRFLAASLEALAIQSIPAKEIIVVDDVSTDDSVKIIESMRARYPTIRLLRNERNLGFNHAINHGVQTATGDCLFFPAADDQVLPGFFEKSLTLLSRYPRAGLCSTLASLLGPNGEDLGPYHTRIVLDAPGYLTPEQARATFESDGNWVVTYSAIYRRRAYRRLGGHDPALGPNSDGLLNFVIPLRHGACFIPERLTLWRKMDDGCAIKTGSDWRRCLSGIETLERRLAAPKLAGLVSRSWLRTWKRHSILTGIYELNRLDAIDAEGLIALTARLPERLFPDRIYEKALQNLPGATRWITQLYVLSQQKPGRISRIIAGKTRAFLGLSAR